jgi:hypothetical protein
VQQQGRNDITEQAVCKASKNNLNLEKRRNFLVTGLCKLNEHLKNIL